MSEVFTKMKVSIVIFLITTTIVSKEFATTIFRVLSTTGRNFSSHVPHNMILTESTVQLSGACKSRRKLLLPAGEEKDK
jgi:hypothetical protein